MNDSSTLQAGWSEIEFTPAPGLPLLGQMHRRLATHAGDPLCAIGLALRNENTTAVLVACDVCILDNEFVARTQKSFASRTGLDASTLLIHATHTHVAPISSGALIENALPEFENRLHDAVIEAAQTALKNLEPVEVFASSGELEYMGWNRRAMYADGTSRMYGNSEDEGFIGMEGPRDGQLPVLWTKNASGKISGVLTGFATHPNCLENECFYSADLPGAARKHLKNLLGENSLGEATRVLYLTGAAGNTAPSVLDPVDAFQPWRGESGVEKSGEYFAAEIARVIAQMPEPMTSQVLNLQHSELQIPLRAWPQPNSPTFPAWPDNEYYVRAAKAWPQRLQDQNPFAVNVSALRIGDAVICANPAELFVEFGLEIKQQSPARVTFISELTNGYCGYVPTAKAFARGGYETWCAPSSQLAFEAGDQIVAATNQLLAAVFEK